jgi:hypothetical protein
LNLLLKVGYIPDLQGGSAEIQNNAKDPSMKLRDKITFGSGLTYLIKKYSILV